jgi:hypothetical protein
MRGMMLWRRCALVAGVCPLCCALCAAWTGGARRPLSISHDGTTADDLLLMDILWSDPTDRPHTAPSLRTADAQRHARTQHQQPICTARHARTPHGTPQHVRHALVWAHNSAHA